MTNSALERQPIGKEFADDVEQRVQDLATGAVNWYHEASAEQEGYLDDALRLTAGGIKNIGNWWAESTRDQEGIGDDILRGVGSVVGTGFRILDAGSYYGGKLGGGFATLLGVDARIGGAIGNVAGDLFAGGIAAKGFKTAKMTHQISKLRAAGITDWQLDAITKGQYVMAFGDDIPNAGVLDDVKTAFTARKGAGKKLSKLETSLTGAQRKQSKQDFFTKIYDPTGVNKELYTYTGSAHPTGIMTAQKRNPVLPEQLQKEFGRKYAAFPGFNMSPHHFTIDDDLGYSVISKVKTANQAEVVSILNDTYGIYPGNHPKNFMMSYHDNTALRYKQEIKQIRDAWDDFLIKNPNSKLKTPELSEITSFQKARPEGKMIGGKESFNRPLADTLLEEIDLIADVRKKGLDKKSWSSILPPGVKRSDLTFDPVVLGIDHQALIHGIGDKLPDRLKLLELSKTKKWAKMTPLAQAREIAKVSRQQQNVALRISKMRLELIKKRMIELGKPIDNWTDIQVWMIQNPTEAASLNYHKILSEGVDIPMDIITKDLPLKEAQEVANVFNIEVVNKTGRALDAYRSQVKEIKRDIKFTSWI